MCTDQDDFVEDMVMIRITITAIFVDGCVRLLGREAQLREINDDKADMQTRESQQAAKPG